MIRVNLDVEVIRSGQAVVVYPEGELSLRSVPVLRTALLKCVADEPAGVIVQLDRLTVATPIALSVFEAVSRRAAEWPGTLLVLVVAPGQLRELVWRSTVDRFVPTFATISEALRSLGTPPVRQLATVELFASDSSPRQARAFVTRICGQWQVEDAVTDACLIASELVENAILHGRSNTARLQLELRRGLLTVAVRDDSPLLPENREVDVAESGGWGIFMVDALSRVWGSAPTWTGGKVVWAVLAVARED